ncbi:hypothetical protein PHYSODRAFT_332488 [Phytophthora sojae]|uniref:PiggyBac transposable element-derived protein domain-containing protein n=1 Tax=Phytophthora sojae (strain P6497) TaxID=1094619 RepID=G4ZIA8_PHYSP|nr:hypothetical protein PHYSODRAFT_332488 [Phytophthora sojae]EGZ18745.1 hypothetical protein PHYSODRAFT_332488 [Phytophthora sojae]|eukprot:XP_009527803.1 hypothetical protein PHYSODRAFT_332488 [Phytophthora sojae]
MVAPVGKTPRHTLTPAEKKKCLEALRRERRLRRAEEKEARARAAAVAPPKTMAAAAANANLASAEAKQAVAEATTAVAEAIPGADEEGAAPAEPKATGKTRKAPTRKKVPDQTLAMWRSGPASAATAARAQDAAPAAVASEVAGAMASIVATIVEEATPVDGATPRVAPDSVTSSTRPGTKPSSSGKRKRVETTESRKRRRRILDEDSADDEGDNDEEVDSSEEAGVSADAAGVGARVDVSLDCVVDGDPNLMDDGAAACTGINSDENPDVREEPEDKEDAEDDDSWDGDWDISQLTDEESEEEREELPESVCSSAAMDTKYITAMRNIGWEYGESKFGPDPTYADLYDGPYGPTPSVLEVAEDPLALLFYFMPPKLCAQIAQQRKSGGEVKDLGDIRRRLAGVKDIEAYEVLQVMGLLIARVLAPIRKGIAAHWSVAKVGTMPANRCSLFMSKNRFFHIMVYMHLSNNKSPKAKTDRAWKIRPVVDVLQRTFACGYRVPPIISFDEATLPSRSRYNPTRQFNKDKPHKWGRRCSSLRVPRQLTA